MNFATVFTNFINSNSVKFLSRASREKGFVEFSTKFIIFPICPIILQLSYGTWNKIDFTALPRKKASKKGGGVNQTWYQTLSLLRSKLRSFSPWTAAISSPAFHPNVFKHAQIERFPPETNLVSIPHNRLKNEMHLWKRLRFILHCCRTFRRNDTAGNSLSRHRRVTKA